MQSKCDSRDRVDGAATVLLLEWVEKLFNEKIPTLKDLALFLIDKMYVDNRSVAAITLLSSTTGQEKNKNVFNGFRKTFFCLQILAPSVKTRSPTRGRRRWSRTS